MSVKALIFVSLFMFSKYCPAQFRIAPIRGECAYYLFQDSLRECGKRGYLLRYGYKYCDFFLNQHLDRFSTEGKQWALDLGYCLQMKIDEFSDTLSCRELKKAARKTHLPCLLESGYLDLDQKDQKVYKRLGARNPFNWPQGLYYMGQLNKASKDH